MLLGTATRSSFLRFVFHSLTLLQPIHLIFFHLPFSYLRFGCVPLAVHQLRVPGQSRSWLPDVLRRETYAASHTNHTTFTMCQLMRYHNRNCLDQGHPVLLVERDCTRRGGKNKGESRTRLPLIQNKRGKISSYFSKGKEAVLLHTLPLINPWSTLIILSTCSQK